MFEKLSPELDEAWHEMQLGNPQEDAWADLTPNQELQ